MQMDKREFGARGSGVTPDREARAGHGERGAGGTGVTPFKSRGGGHGGHGGYSILEWWLV